MLADQHRQRRRADQAVLLHVPAGRAQQGVACRRHGREVGHRGAGGEAHRRLGRQAQQLDRPAPGDLLHHRGGRRGGIEAAVLVPRRRQPVGGQAGRQAAADDEAEVARPGGRDEARVGRAGQVGHDRRRIGRGVGHRPAERRFQRRLRHALGHADAPVGEALAVGDGQVGGPPQGGPRRRLRVRVPCAGRSGPPLAPYRCRDDLRHDRQGRLGRRPPTQVQADRTVQAGQLRFRRRRRRGAARGGRPASCGCRRRPRSGSPARSAVTMAGSSNLTSWLRTATASAGPRPIRSATSSGQPTLEPVGVREALAVEERLAPVDHDRLVAERARQRHERDGHLDRADDDQPRPGGERLHEPLRPVGQGDGAARCPRRCADAPRPPAPRARPGHRPRSGRPAASTTTGGAGRRAGAPVGGAELGRRRIRRQEASGRPARRGTRRP